MKSSTYRKPDAVDVACITEGECRGSQRGDMVWVAGRIVGEGDVYNTFEGPVVYIRDVTVRSVSEMGAVVVQVVGIDRREKPVGECVAPFVVPAVQLRATKLRADEAMLTRLLATLRIYFRTVNREGLQELLSGLSDDRVDEEVLRWAAGLVKAEKTASVLSGHEDKQRSKRAEGGR